MKYFLLVLILSLQVISFPQDEGAFQIARLKYSGGGDWYNDPSAEVNLLKYVRSNTNIKVKPEYKFVELSTDEIFSFPFLFVTGHGNIVFTQSEAERLRKYLENGGFIYIDDDYGLDKAVRREMKKVYSDKEFVEIPFGHGIYNAVYKFDGPPKTHKHDENPPRGYGLFLGEGLAVY
ncbi:MAG: DUF4159 domain-containing protein, partial [Ignavibacteriaceae bacterium]